MLSCKPPKVAAGGSLPSETTWRTIDVHLLFTSMGSGSVIGAVFVISWLRARFSPDSVTLSANLLIVLAYMLMAFVRQVEVFFVVAALAGVGWTLSASELWVAAQRAMPSWARGRINASVIMISQGAMVFGGLIWSFVASPGLIPIGTDFSWNLTKA